MKEGKIEIFLSYEEPVFKDNIMWLRPYLNKEGYELLYYGAKGWTRFIPCYPSSTQSTDDCIETEPCEDIDPCKCTTN